MARQKIKDTGMNDVLSIRKQLVKSCKRVVIKAGTRLLVDAAALARLVEQIKTVRDSGIQVILVSSGAVGTGMKSLGLKKRPKHLSDVQALAAIGQIHLMALYSRRSPVSRTAFECPQLSGIAPCNEYSAYHQ